MQHNCGLHPTPFNRCAISVNQANAYQQSANSVVELTSNEPKENMGKLPESQPRASQKTVTRPHYKTQYKTTVHIQGLTLPQPHERATCVCSVAISSGCLLRCCRNHRCSGGGCVRAALKERPSALARAKSN